LAAPLVMCPHAIPSVRLQQLEGQTRAMLKKAQKKQRAQVRPRAVSQW
jgi:hypothetical protein